MKTFATVSVVLIILSIVGLFIYVVPGLIFILISVIKFANYPNKCKKWEEEKKVFAKNKAQYEADLKAKDAIVT